MGGTGSAPGWTDAIGADGWFVADWGGALGATGGDAGPGATRDGIPGDVFGRLSTVDGTKSALSPAGRWVGASPPCGRAEEAGAGRIESGGATGKGAGEAIAGFAGVHGRPGVHGAKAREGAVAPPDEFCGAGVGWEGGVPIPSGSDTGAPTVACGAMVARLGCPVVG